MTGKEDSTNRKPHWILWSSLVISTVISVAIYINWPRAVVTPPAPGRPAGPPIKPPVTASVKPPVAQPEQTATEEVWETEVFADAASKQLAVIGDILKQGRAVEPNDVDPLLTADFQCVPLRPDDPTNVYSNSSLSVYCGDIDESVTHDGEAGLAVCLTALAQPLIGRTEIHIKFKVISVDVDDAGISTNVVYQASGRAENDTVQQSALWTCRWQSGSNNNRTPLLTSIRAARFEEVVAQAATGTLFADCTFDIFRNEPLFEKQFVPGIDTWRTSTQAQYGVYPYGHHGIAVGDVNDDGLDDLYVCQPAGLPNRMYLQNADGTVTDVAAKMGIDWMDRSRGALLVDLDNDDDQDLVVAINEMLVVMGNDGDRTYSEKTVFRPTGDPGSLTAADYDLDGDLDIYIVNYGQRFLSDGESSGPVPYHDANNGGENILLRNDGDWVFRDVTKQSGLNRNNRRWSFAASWEDFDNDGDPDLYVANDFGRNNLYRNDGGRFVDIAAEAGVEDIAAGMSVSWADYNQDGQMDLYVGNMFSSAGLRIAYQDRFQSEADSRVRGEFQRHARGNSLFQNAGDGTFRDVSEQAGVTLGRWSWSSKFVDINNDSLEDMVVANGFVTGSDTDDL